jgi:chromate reductase, NAD(P)H dehydrogenase (quinone)
MSQINIAVIVGSLRRDSFNAKFAQAIAKLAPADLTFKHSQIGDLPLYNQDDDASQAPQVKRLKAEIAAAQGLLFVTPEYNRSVPGVLKNAIDHASRPYLDDALGLADLAGAALSDSRRGGTRASYTPASASS